ncbi:hypothetical protein [Psychromonas aquimarina]|uniref:hypothetical protein n=1 Tax=Psychromonas aquimarina TaxID=444919 RepID=UPI00040973D4|nr:hypothetical protein [Psychromonas aquimarina]
MQDIHQLAILPNQDSINCVAEISNDFNANDAEIGALLAKLQHVVVDSGFMSGQDNHEWMASRGCNFIANPKLFDSAPLTYTCVFIGELFNNMEPEEILLRVPAPVIKHALLRMHDFTSM